MRKHAPTLLIFVALAMLAAACGDDMMVDEDPTVSPGAPSTNVQVANLDKAGEASVLTVEVPSGAQSVALVLDGGADLVTAGTVASASGTEVFSFFEDVNTNRTDATDGIYTLLLPNNPAVTLSPGQWKVTFITDKPDGFVGEVQAIYKTAPASAKTLDLNLYFVGVEGLDAEKAKTDANFQKILTSVEGIYGGAGISFGAVEYLDITGADADKFGVLDSTSGPSSELAQLFEKSADRSGRSLNFFFVADIQGAGGGFSLLGLAGGVPGPPGLHGTTSSGVAVNMADFATDPETIEIIMAHEAGHYLGLYHTTEANGAALSPEGRQPIHGFDPLSDTSMCGDDADANGNGTLSPSECTGDGGNLMFWSPANDSRALSAQQGQVMVSNPLVK